ncbi:MAG TPA: radical SAM protein [Thermoanaerobaculia bacterium]|nr:radical SAM protein [Thermoanaerobaculia bacterium]
MEDERTERGDVVATATLFLTNRECPWRCLMCDLWKDTTEKPVGAGVLPEQIRGALASLEPVRPARIKLYNSGSFFDPGAVAPEDLPAIARMLAGFERVIVESHPDLVGQRCFAWRRMLEAELEVAMGLETVHPEVLPKLNKRMTLDGFRRAADSLRANGVALRVFVLLGLPFVSREESEFWTRRSIEAAFDFGATAVSVIPTRTGNGAMDELESIGAFAPPTLEMLEEAAAFGLALGRGRVFADLWDVERLRRCPACFPGRVERLRRMNLSQVLPAPVRCEVCGAAA